MNKGLANLFQGELSKMSGQQNKSEVEQMRALLQNHLTEVGTEANLLPEWNSGGMEAQRTAMVVAFASFIKRYNIPVKQLGKFELEKISTFVSKKLKLKKTSPIACRSHVFVELLETSSRSTCLICSKPFWGVAYHGLVCQSISLFDKINIILS